MSEKPKKRLVSKSRYAGVLTTRIILLCVVLAFAKGGIDAFCLVAQDLGHERTLLIDSVLVDVVNVCLASGMLFVAYWLFKKERKIERVSPITTRTTSSLPPEETLVRPSDLPPSQQQAELLRAAQYGKGTPAEELLRASTTDDQDKDIK